MLAIRRFIAKYLRMTIQLDLPNSIGLSSFEVTMNLAAKLFERGLISSGQAAQIVGISKKAFIEIVGQYGVSIFQYDEDELADELKNL
jgi:predicted HTH domain antitoxin